MKTLVISLSVVAIALPIIGCGGGESTVSTSKPKDEFIKQAENNISDLEGRVDKAKQDVANQSGSAKATVETATEQAEEKLETLRDTLLPQLRDASGEQSIEDTKKRVNDAQNKIGNASEDARNQFNVLKEDIEEALDEAGDQLNQYKNASGETAQTHKSEVERLLGDARSKLGQAEGLLPSNGG